MSHKKVYHFYFYDNVGIFFTVEFRKDLRRSLN